MRHLALCHDEFHGPRSGLCLSGGISDNITTTFKRSQWTVDDSLVLGTWTDKQSSIPYHNVFDAGLDFVAFFSLRSDMSAIGCGDGIRENY
ncbi:hypothetical protein TNCV_2829211 [Trichonephila clavipes]|nr:hypothetical protein TNCV_2829211 [Trichonephila clavipes]